MNLDEDDYQLLTCALQQNFAEAGPLSVQDISGTLTAIIVYWNESLAVNWLTASS